MKEVDTVVNKQYVVTSSGACTVTAILPSGGTLELVSTQGGQASFVAVSGSVVVSDDAALVSGPFAKAPAVLGAGGGGASGPVAPADIPADGVLKGGKTYIVTATDGLDLSALTVEQYGTAELWLDYTAGSVTWPTGLWWVEGDAPTLEAGKTYAIALRNDGVKFRANVQYEDTNPAQA